MSKSANRINWLKAEKNMAKQDVKLADQRVHDAQKDVRVSLLDVKSMKFAADIQERDSFLQLDVEGKVHVQERDEVQVPVTPVTPVTPARRDKKRLSASRSVGLSGT